MQASPFHTNKIFDGKFSMLNVPKSSKNASWRLVKDVDEKTGNFKYTLVNNELDSKVLETKLNLMKETEVDNDFEKEKGNQETILEQENNEQTFNDNISTVARPTFEHSMENNATLIFDFEKFTAKTRNLIITPFSLECVKANSKEFQKLSENSRFLDYKKDYYTKVNNIIFSIEGYASDTFSNVHVTVSLKFINRTSSENIVYNYSTSKLVLKNENGKLFQQFVGNIGSFIQNSNNNLITYAPTIQIHNENDAVADYHLYIKTILKYEKVHKDDMNVSEEQFLSRDVLNYK